MILAAETGPRELRFEKVIKRSLLTMVEYGVSEVPFDSSPFRDLLNRIMESGGYWQLVFNFVLVVFIDPDTYDPREEIDAMREERDAESQ